MSFGTKDPHARPHKRLPMISIPWTDCCPICGNKIKIVDDYWQVVMLVIPYVEMELYPQKAIYGCATCYGKNLRLRPSTIDELISYRKTRAMSKAMAVSKVENVRARPTSKERPLKKDLAAPASDVVILTLLRRICEHLGIDASCDVPVTHPESIESSATNLESVESSVTDDLDDIEAGMTDEQRAMMDLAVSMASERTKHVVEATHD